MKVSPLPRRPSANQAAEAALRRAILSGDIAAGDKLPPERELCVSLGISRLTLRAALASLASAGLVEVVHGSGYRACNYLHSGGPDLLPGLVELVHKRRDLCALAGDLLRVRRHLACAVLEALADTPPPAAAIARFRAAIADLEHAAKAAAPARDIAQADLAVIRVLLAASASPVLSLCHNPIAQVVGESDELCAAVYADPMRSVRAWTALASWMDAPDRAGIAGFVATLEAHDRSTLQRLAGPRRKGPRP